MSAPLPELPIMPATQATPARDSFVFLLLMASVVVVPMSVAWMGRLTPATPVAPEAPMQRVAYAG